MEMRYDGTLVMPQNFSVVTADEMVYIDGGDGENLCNNLKGLWLNYRVVRQALIGSGYSWADILACAKMGYFAAISFVASMGVLPITAISRIAGAVVAGGALAFGTAMYFCRLFY